MLSYSREVLVSTPGPAREERKMVALSRIEAAFSAFPCNHLKAVCLHGARGG